MNGPFFFGVGSRRLSAAKVKALERIARENDADFIHCRMPEGWRFWFETPNYGEPFNRRTMRDTLDQAEREGVWPA